MYPESEHVLDWIHIAMRLNVLNQFARGVCHTEPDGGGDMLKYLEQTRWFLWHGNITRALETLDNLYYDIDAPDVNYPKRRKFTIKLEEWVTYIHNNASMMANGGAMASVSLIRLSSPPSTRW